MAQITQVAVATGFINANHIFEIAHRIIMALFNGYKCRGRRHFSCTVLILDRFPYSP